MRKVIVYRFPSREFNDDVTLNKIFDGIGTFHEWSTDYEEFESGPAQYPVAIVEMEDGAVKLVHPTFIEFANSNAVEENIVVDDSDKEKQNGEIDKLNERITELLQENVNIRSKLDHYENLVAEFMKIVERFGINKMWTS